ncbi:MAG: DUF4915 domain-containing protein [Gemmataceae bacterium]|nr:DUF4915 domain-containing protein [Gemmataceae bacterium]
MVALVDNEIVGALLAVARSHNLLVETLAVAGGHRCGGLNLALMYRSAEAAAALGIQTIEFEHDTQESDIAKLARRFGATQIGCRQCWGAFLPASDQATQERRDRFGEPDPALARPTSDSGRAEEVPPLHSVHTSNFPAILQELGISVLVTTYQAGKLVMLRANGGRLNTHFRSFSKPMGLAVDGDRLAIGTAVEIWEYHHAPAVARRLEPTGSHDACFLPRSSLCTGDIQIHEMAWGQGAGGRSQESGVRNQEAGGRNQAALLTPDPCSLTPELLPLIPVS